MSLLKQQQRTQNVQCEENENPESIKVEKREEKEEEEAEAEQVGEKTLYVYAKWEDWNAWQAMLSQAARQIDDAADGSHSWYDSKTYALPLIIEARDKFGKVYWASRTDAIRALNKPINRPRCELQATYRVLAAVLRLGGTGGEKWSTIVIDVFGSNYIATNATLPRLRRWYKHGYKTVSNRELWEPIRMALERLAQAKIECKFKSRDI